MTGTTNPVEQGRAVRFDGYGGIDVLDVRDVEFPAPAADEVLVRVRAAGINPGEAVIRSGALDAVFPAQFPSGEGSDLAGVVAAIGADITDWRVGDEVLGWTDRRASQADYVVVPADQLLRKPASVPFEVAGSLYVAGSAAVASVRAVKPVAGETVLVSGASGGVGAIAAQLARRDGARVIGVASERNHAWLRSLGIEPVSYGDGAHGSGLGDAVRQAAPDGVDAVVDTYGGGYVALGLELGVPADRINTIADFAAIERDGVHGEGTSSAGSVATLTELVRAIEDGELTVEIAATYPLDEVRAAFTELERRHTRGKIVLVP